MLYSMPSVQHSPISVMMRGLMERVLQPEKLDGIFARHGKLQYQRELMFSSLVNMMSLVVCGIHPSVNAAYKTKATELRPPEQLAPKQTLSSLVPSSQFEHAQIDPALC
jgi:hypothetical protein